MRLTVKSDYCLRVLIYLQEKNHKVKIQEIADAYNISKNHLSVAANKLSELGYIISSSGPNGGIEFNYKYRDKTVGELISNIEVFDIVECFDSETNTCSLNPHCNLKKMISNASKSFIEELKQYKIKDLI